MRQIICDSCHNPVPMDNHGRPFYRTIQVAQIGFNPDKSFDVCGGCLLDGVLIQMVEEGKRLETVITRHERFPL